MESKEKAPGREQTDTGYIITTLKKQLAILETAQEKSDDKIPFTVEIVKIVNNIEYINKHYIDCRSNSLNA